MYRAKVEKVLADELGAPVKLGGLSVSILSLGATLSDLEIGAASPQTGNRPLATIPSLSAWVTWATISGDEMRLRGLDLSSPDFHLACDETGRSTLAQFLAGMPKGKPREKPLEIDRLRLFDPQATLYVPKQILCPGGQANPGPVTVKLRAVDVAGLALPAPGKPLPKETVIEIELTELAVRSPIEPGPKYEVPAEAGLPIEEGIALGLARAKLIVPASLEEPLRIEGALLQALKVRDVLLGPDEADTLSRIQAARANVLKAPPSDSSAPGVQLGNGGVIVADLKVEGSELQIDGPDASGACAWHRFTEFKIDLQRIGFGPGAETSASAPGLLKIESPSSSSEGEGRLLVDWNAYTGAWPNSSFEQKFELSGVPLTPFHSRVYRAAKLGVSKGHLDTEFAGPVKEGKIEWDGSITISKDTAFTGEGFTSDVKKFVAKAATGEPLKTFRIRGTLAKPNPIPPDMVAGMVFNVLKDAMAGGITGVFESFGEGMGAAIEQGTREAEKLIKKIPGIGGLFGAEDEKTK
ncbi:MAG: hypothetical protein M5U26_24755 [Planctomycetota bacterium]|nr:hypothetical protein [Planctomycetota bacterium]